MGSRRKFLRLHFYVEQIFANHFCSTRETEMIKDFSYVSRNSDSERKTSEHRDSPFQKKLISIFIGPLFPTTLSTHLCLPKNFPDIIRLRSCNNAIHFSINGIALLTIPHAIDRIVTAAYDRTKFIFHINRYFIIESDWKIAS